MELIWQVIWISKMTSEHAKLAFPGLIKIDSVQVLKFRLGAGNALEWVQRVHEPADLWDITFCTR